MRPGRILGLLVSLVAVAVIIGLVLRPATVTGSSGKAVAYSLRGQANADKTGTCRGGSDKFACRVFGSSGRRARYRVSVDNYGCWDAERMGGGSKGLSKSLSGCITILDLIRLGN